MRYKSSGALVLIILFLTVGALAGQHPGCPKGDPGPGGGLWKELGLTEQQREKLHELRLEQEAAHVEFKKRMYEIRKATKEELAKDNPSAAALDRLAGMVGDVAEDIAKQKAKHLLAVKKILTAEQWARLLERNWMLDLGAGSGPHCPRGPESRKGRRGKNVPPPPPCPPHDPAVCPPDEGL